MCNFLEKGMRAWEEISGSAAVEVTLNSPLIQDPRPDLVEDSELWSRLLALAKLEDDELQDKKTVRQEQAGGSLFKVLHGFRCAGTRLRKSEMGSGMYVLRPDIDPTGNEAWMNEAEYKQFSTRYLAPWEEPLTRILKILSFGSR